MIETPFNFTGSKFKLLPQILPELDYSKRKFIDVFCGGGSIYTNTLDKYDQVLVNDIISDLIGIHQGILLNDEIIDSTKIICPEKTDETAYTNLRDNYNNEPSADKLWALMLSCTSNMMRFNQKFKFNQTFGKRSWNANTEKKVEVFKNHIRKYSNKINFSSKSFHELEIQKDTMYYIDPPYGRIKNEDGSIGKKQISEAGYNAFWKEDDDKKLYQFIHKINEVGSSFMVSGVLYHNGLTCWILDKLIKDGFCKITLNFDYNKVSRKGDKETIEIIIKNY
jgi:DNA adenine methylase Dam